MGCGSENAMFLGALSHIRRTLGTGNLIGGRALILSVISYTNKLPNLSVLSHFAACPL